MNRVGKSQQILLTKGQRDIFNNSQGLKTIQEKPQGLKCNIELIFKNIRPQKIVQKTKEKKFKNPRFSIRRRTAGEGRKFCYSQFPLNQPVFFHGGRLLKQTKLGKAHTFRVNSLAEPGLIGR